MNAYCEEEREGDAVEKNFWQRPHSYFFKIGACLKDVDFFEEDGCDSHDDKEEDSPHPFVFLNDEFKIQKVRPMDGSSCKICLPFWMSWLLILF